MVRSESRSVARVRCTTCVAMTIALAIVTCLSLNHARVATAAAACHIAPHNNCNGALLAGGDFASRDLAGTTFIRADLRRAVLVGANLQGADLTRADLRGAQIS